MIAGGYRQLTRALGILPGRWNPTPRAEGRWDLVVHGASAGEVRAASCWIESFQSQSPKLRILRTCSTATGIAAGAQAQLPRDVPQAVGEGVAVEVGRVPVAGLPVGVLETLVEIGPGDVNGGVLSELGVNARLVFGYGVLVGLHLSHPDLPIRLGSQRARVVPRLGVAVGRVGPVDHRACPGFRVVGDVRLGLAVAPLEGRSRSPDNVAPIEGRHRKDASGRGYDPPENKNEDA